ncbi:MAG: glycosyltransferase [Eubacterium sp.]|jgi:hypothetical protein|nr:glycosyltransferase [Eubacterium sp.]
MNILYVANLIPYPLDGGGKIFTYSTIQALGKQNDVDLVCFYEHEDIKAGKQVLLKHCSSIETIPIRVTTRENMTLMMIKAFQSFFSHLPLGVSKYIVPEMKAMIRKKMITKKYDRVFFNILSMFGYYEFIKNIDPEIKTVLYEQNCESLIYKRYFNQTNNILKKIFLKIETEKLTKFEQKAVNKTEHLIMLSDEDRREVGVPVEKCSIIPVGIMPTDYHKFYKPEEKGRLKMLFIGTMTWMPNNHGIIWFLENVMPLCNDISKYELFIVGKNPSERVRKLSENYDNVHLMGYVESLDSIYDECDIVIVPLFIGSGQRVKIIEAFSRGHAIISTSIGVEGLQYENNKTILIADDACQFKTQIDRCFNRNLLKTIGEGGKNIFDTEYSTNVITKKINAAIQL